MPAFGGLELILQILLVVHVVRTNRPYMWIYLIMFLPLVGPAVYLLAEVLPGFVGARTTRQMSAGVVHAINPGRALREATRRVQITPTIENKTALAAEFQRLGNFAEAEALYRDVMGGIHATDPVIMLGLARTVFAQRKIAETAVLLADMRRANPGYHSPEGHLLYARSLELQGLSYQALAEYGALITYYPGQEARCRYAQLLQKDNQTGEARKIFEEICQSLDYGPRHQWREQRQWYDIAKRQLAAT